MHLRPPTKARKSDLRDDNTRGAAGRVDYSPDANERVAQPGAEHGRFARFVALCSRLSVQEGLQREASTACPCPRPRVNHSEFTITILQAPLNSQRSSAAQDHGIFNGKLMLPGCSSRLTE